MRRSTTLVLAVAVAIGCGDDDKKTQDTATPDTVAPDTGDTADSADTSDTGPGDSTEPDTADTSEPDTVDTADGGEVTPAADFACLGTDPTYPTGTGTVEYDVRLIDYVTRGPLPDVHAQWCERFDPFCESPVHEGTSDADGLLHVKVPAGFDGFVFGEGGGIVPSIQVVDPPITQAPEIQPVPFQLINPLQLTTIAALYAVTIDAAAGHAVLVALDCDGNPVIGAKLTVANSDDAHIGYLEAGLPSAAATSTDESGAAVAFNLSPGWHRVTAETPDGEVYGRGNALIVAGSATQVFVAPQQTTPDLSCDALAAPTSFVGDVSVTFRLRDFGTLAPIAGAHLKVCAAADQACATPLDEGDSDELGDAVATFAFTAEGFDGFLEITGAGTFPTRLNYIRPLSVGGATAGPLIVDLLTTDEAALFAQVAGAEIDPELAHVAIAVVDCDFVSAHGMSVSAAPTTPKTKVIYVGSGLPAPAATATDDSGLAGIFNVPAGEEVVISATFGETPVGSVTITPMKGFIHEFTLFPTP